MIQYHVLLEEIMDYGVLRKDRTGTGTLSVFGTQGRYSLQHGFPLVTTKAVHLKSVIHELLWIISGNTNVKYLQDNGVRIWNEWADEDGELGPVYGAQWRSFGWTLEQGGVDQLQGVIDSIKRDPYSRRHIVSAWNPQEVDDMALPPCHVLFQFYVMPGEGRDVLSCQMYQRSADMFLGVPFNIASYSLLTMMIAKLCNLEPGEFVHSIGDAHIYMNHMEQVEELLQRECRPLPTMIIHGDQQTIDDFKYEDFELLGYDPHPSIPAKVAV